MPPEGVCEALARQDLHEVVRHPLVIAGAIELEDLDDAGVREMPEGASFHLEAFDEVPPMRERAVQHLQHEQAADVLVLDEIDGAHPARAEDGLDEILGAIAPDRVAGLVVVLTCRQEISPPGRKG